MPSFAQFLATLAAEAVHFIAAELLGPSIGCTSTLLSGDAPDESAAKRKRNRMIAFAAGGVALVAVAGGAITWVVVGGPSQASVQTATQQVLKGFECARLAADVDGKRNVVVRGHVRSEDDLKRLAGDLQKVPGVTQLALEVTTVIHPHCAAVILLEPLMAAAENAPKIALRGDATQAAVGSFMKVEVQGAPFEGYVYVDFYDRLGNVFHLAPNAVLPDNRLPANGRLVIGEEKPGNRVYKLTEPLGQQVVTVITTKKPLFAGQRLEKEQAGEYLGHLEKAIKGAEAGSVSASLLVFDTVAK